MRVSYGGHMVRDRRRDVRCMIRNNARLMYNSNDEIYAMNTARRGLIYGAPRLQSHNEVQHTLLNVTIAPPGLRPLFSTPPLSASTPSPRLP